MGFEMCNMHLCYGGSLEASMGSDRLLGASGSHLSLLPEGREMTPFGS